MWICSRRGASRAHYLYFLETCDHFFLDLKRASAYYADNTGKEVVQGMISFRPGEVAEA